jgi:cell division protein FtsI/penicillin-binding protein 2
VIHDGGTSCSATTVFRSHGDEGLGPVDMTRSIVKSSNVYYYSLANEMGVDLMHEQLEPFGFGRNTGIDLDGEVTGVLPSTDWKKRAYKQARAAALVRRRDHLAGHRPGLQQLHHAAAGQRHRHAGVRRPALQAAPGARDRGRRHRPAPAPWPGRAVAAAAQARACGG